MILDEFWVRNRFREASDEVKGERVSLEESWRADVYGGGPGCERLWLKGVRRTAAWEHGL